MSAGMRQEFPRERRGRLESGPGHLEGEKSNVETILWSRYVRRLFAALKAGRAQYSTRPCHRAPRIRQVVLCLSTGLHKNERIFSHVISLELLKCLINDAKERALAVPPNVFRGFSTLE